MRACCARVGAMPHAARIGRRRRVRTVGCALKRLVPDAGHLDALRQAVASTHKSTFLATELLNLHLRRVLAAENDAADDDALRCFFDANWLMNAYNEVTVAAKASRAKVEPALRATLEQCMPPFAPPVRMHGVDPVPVVRVPQPGNRSGHHNVWKHFVKRALAHVCVDRLSAA